MITAAQAILHVAKLLKILYSLYCRHGRRIHWTLGMACREIFCMGSVVSKRSDIATADLKYFLEWSFARGGGNHSCSPNNLIPCNVNANSIHFFELTLAHRCATFGQLRITTKWFW